MLSSEFLVSLAEKVYGTLRPLEGAPRPLGETLFGRSGGEISAPLVFAGFSVVSGRTCAFVDTLFELMKEKGIGDAVLSAKMGWPQETLVGLRADRNICPVKELVFAFALVLELNRDEVRRLMASGGLALSKEEVYDIVVLHCMDEGVFDINDVNQALKCFNLKPIMLGSLKDRLARNSGPA